ncbi:MAG: hypothetical protein HC850_03905 [Rhodomicrobium sp.]|nr:hypothetical protein [Rhodomicrobium sp.]
MTHEKWNQIIDLWNRGLSIQEIANHTGVSERELGRGLLSAVERGVRLRSNAAGRK